LHLHKSFVATSNPNKNGFSSPLSWRAQACKWKRWKRKRYKEEDGAVPTSPSTPSSSPNVFFVPQKCQRSISPRENRRKRANLPHQRTLAHGGRVSLPGASHQTGGKSSRYRPTVTNSGAWLALVWCLALTVVAAWRCLCVARRFLLTFLHFSLLFRVTHLSGLLE